MGVYKYPPKHYNPNWSSFSARKKRYEDAKNKKKSSNTPNTPRKSNGTKPHQPLTPRLW